MQICGCTHHMGDITGISYNCCDDTVMVSYCGVVVAVNKCSGATKKVYAPCKGNITGIYALCPLLIVAIDKGRKSYICVVDMKERKEICFQVKGNFPISNILLGLDAEGDKIPFLSYISLGEDDALESYEQTDFMEAFGTRPCGCNFKIFQECCCSLPLIFCKECQSQKQSIIFEQKSSADDEGD